MVSFSTPFSRETASTTNNTSLPIVSAPLYKSELRYQPGPIDRLEGQLKLFVIHFHHHRSGVDLHQLAGKVAPPAVERTFQLHFHRLTHALAKILQRNERPVQPRRRHLERETPRDRILDVEDGRHL